MDTTIWAKGAIEALVDDFDKSCVCRSRWTHEAHLVAATVYLERYGGVEGAIDPLRLKIIRLNKANGVINDKTSGYHHSVTLFMLLAIQCLLDSTPANTIKEKVKAVMNSDLRASKFPFYFYSHDLMADPQCRTNWVEPDLRPLTMLPKLLGVGAGI